MSLNSSILAAKEKARAVATAVALILLSGIVLKSFPVLKALLQ